MEEKKIESLAKGNIRNMKQIQIIVSSSALMFFSNAAYAHENREPGFSGWISHQFEFHTGMTVLVSAFLIFQLAKVIYRGFLEPDFKKQARKDRGGDSGCTADSDSGCSGCGGCGGD